MPNIFTNFKNNLDKFSLESQNLIQNYPVAGFGLGIALVPISLTTRTIAQKTLDLLGFSSASISERWANIPNFYKKSFSEYMWLSSWAIGVQILSGEFIQNYILNQQFSKLLNKFAPRFKDYPNTTKGKILRIVVAALPFATVRFLQLNNQMENKLVKGYFSNQRIQVKSYTTGFAFACAINRFITGLFGGIMREVTGSNLPGIGLYFIDGL